MATFVMLGKYSAAAIKEISKERSVKAEALIKKFGGKIDITERDAILNYLANNDPTKLEALEKLRRKILLNILYSRRVESLNELLNMIAYLKYLKNESKKTGG